MEKVTCEKCGAQFYASEIACPACWHIVRSTDAPPEMVPVPDRQHTDWRFLAKRAGLCVVLGLTGFGLLFTGSFHVISAPDGWQMHGCQVVRKTRFTWRESFVRLEDVEESLEDTVLDGKDFRYPRLLTAAEREAAQKTR